MNLRVWRRLAAVGAFLALLLPYKADAQKQEEWTWKDGKRTPRKRTELDKILDAHKLWVQSNYSQGSRADLSGAYLANADLRGASLIYADLTDTELYGADLTRANLSHADLVQANLSSARLDGADLRQADLTRANLHEAVLNGADLSNADLSDADLSQSNLDAKLIGSHMRGAFLDGASLGRADLSHADLTNASLDYADLDDVQIVGTNLTNVTLNHKNLAGKLFVGTNLTNAILNDDNLNDAQFIDTELKDADFSRADLQGAIFEPRSIPGIRIMATVKHLESMSYVDSPDALVQLRKQFQENGFRTQERKITYALSRRKAELDGPVEKRFQRLAFDLTCQYGMNPGRALQIWLALMLFCWLIYAVFIHVPGESGIYRLQKTGEPTAKEEIEEQIRPRTISSRPLWQYPLRFIQRELRVLFWAGFFSLMSAFNIGFRDINFGRWLRLLPRTEYDLKAKGWARTVAGFQSLISVYLIALWILAYFGRPFE